MDGKIEYYDQNTKSNPNNYSARKLFGKITFIQEVVDAIKDREMRTMMDTNAGRKWLEK